MAELLDQMRYWIEYIIGNLGYTGIALVMLLENVFPPIPSELVMPFAGFLVDKGEFNFLGIVFAGTLGSVLGAVVLYYVGLWADERVIRSFIRRFGWLLMLSEDDLNRSLSFFDRYSQPVVFFGRLIPLIRSLISLPAGINRMPMGRFLLFTTLGSAIWTTLLAFAGVLLAENWEQILGYVKQYERVTLVIIVVAVVVFAFTRLRARWQKTRLT